MPDLNQQIRQLVTQHLPQTKCKINNNLPKQQVIILMLHLTLNYCKLLAKYLDKGIKMFLTEMFNQPTRNVVVIYPGRFQPFHKGHKAVYDMLVSNYGSNNTWIATSDKVDPPRSPFSFNEKVAMIEATSIPTNKVIKTVQPYQANEILANYDSTSTVVLYAVSQKDMEEAPRFSFAPKKDGSPSYFQPAPNSLEGASTFDKHGYILTVPTTPFNVLGQPMQSATAVREQYASADEQTRKQIVKDLYGTFDENVYRILNSKLANTESDKYSIDECTTSASFATAPAVSTKAGWLFGGNVGKPKTRKKSK